MFVKTLNVTLYDTVPLLDKAGNQAIVRASEAEEWCARGYRRLTVAEIEKSAAGVQGAEGGNGGTVAATATAAPNATTGPKEPDVASMTTKELVEFCRSESLGLDVSAFSAMDEKRKAVLAAWRNKHRG